MLQLNSELYDQIFAECCTALTLNSETIWNAPHEKPAPTNSYRLPDAFRSLERTPFIPWHFEHAQFDKNARRDRTLISPLLIILTVGASTYVPVEYTLMTRCAICALLRKILPYFPWSKTNGLRLCLEFKYTQVGKRQVVVLQASHGVIAHSVLVDVLKCIGEGDVVKLKVT
jgi:hypothetical protein